MAEAVPLFGPSTNREQRLTKRELAALWRVSERTIERWMTAGLPFEKPFRNGSVRFVPSEVEAWARDRTGRVPPRPRGSSGP